MIPASRACSKYFSIIGASKRISGLESALVSRTTMANANYFSSNKPPKVLVTCPNTPKMGITFLKENGCQIIMLEKSSEEDVLKHIAEVDALLLAPPLKLTKRILDVAVVPSTANSPAWLMRLCVNNKKNLRSGKVFLNSSGSRNKLTYLQLSLSLNFRGNMKTIATLSAGYDHIDVNDLKRRGIKLGNTPNVVNAAVADIAVLLALAAARRLHEGRLKIENNQWQSDYQWMLGQDVCNSTIGIVGLGGIGQAVAKRLKGFEVRQILYTGHREKPEGEDLGAKFVSLDTLLRDSDFVIICVPLTNETENMCNQDFFSKMKKTAVFVNISRGKVVDQPALIEALKNGTIFAAGLDVMTPEPLPPDHDLLKLPNVVLMPHLGTATVNTENEMSLLAAKNILKGLAGEEMIHPVV